MINNRYALNMRGLAALVLALCAFQVVLGTSHPADWIRGVAPQEQSLYKVKEFKCRGENKQISASKINDNYCDCADGSDEPGTSACPNGLFYCENKGFRGEVIFASRINDGICDCCDGSDEYEGKVKCPNTCEAMGAELRKQQQEEKERHQKGLEIKKQYIADATRVLNEKRATIDPLKAEIDKLKQAVEHLEAEKKGFEEKESAERAIIEERKQELERLEAERLAREAPTETEESANLKEMLKQQEEGAAAPEAAPEAVPEATPEATAPTVPPLPPLPPLPPTPAPVQQQDSLDESELLKTILEGKKKIEDELNQARRDLSAKENDLKNAEELLNKDFGLEKEFFALHDQCYEHKTREYTYSFCPFSEVKQAHTSLGKFEKWDPPYTVMSFTNGLQCWGGPKRSAKVTFVCGSENQLSDVHEPAKCEYSMKFATPAVCSAAHAEFLEHIDGHSPESYFSH